MNARLQLDLHYRAASAVAKALYAQLYTSRAAIARALPTLSPEATAGAVLGCSPAEAAEHLAVLREIGLVGEGLTLLAGAGRQQAPANTNASPAAATGAADDLRTRAATSGRSTAELARAAGLERSCLARYLAGEKGLGAERRARLEAALAGTVPVPVPATVPGHSAQDTAGTPHETQGILGTAPGTLGTASPAPSPSLVSLPSPPAPPSDSPSEPTHNPTPTAARAGEAGLVALTPATPTRAEVAAQRAAEKLAAREAKEAARAEKRAAQEKARAEKAAAQAALAAADPVPAEGTPARAVYDAIVGDPRLAAITEGPGAYALRAVVPALYPGVDVLTEVLAAGEWLSRQREGSHKKGRAFLANWLRKSARDAATTPRPIGLRPGAPSVAFARPAPRGKAPLATREDYEHDLANPIDPTTFYEETGT